MDQRRIEWKKGDWLGCHCLIKSKAEMVVWTMLVIVDIDLFACEICFAVESLRLGEKQNVDIKGDS